MPHRFHKFYRRTLAIAALAMVPGAVLVLGILLTDPALFSFSGWAAFASFDAIVSATVVALVFHSVITPIRRLATDVLAFKSGTGQTPKQWRQGPAEIRALSDAFAETANALTARENDLRKSIAHQDLLMKEIHHRVKNNLQIVASLLNLQASRLRQPESRDAFQAARDRVRALATLHRHLYSEGGLHTLNMRAFLTELCSQLFQAFGEPEDGRLQLTIEAPEITLSSDQAVPLSLIVTEAVSNSLKYAFPNGRPGTISVRLSAKADAARLLIEDNGIGMSPIPNETETGPRDGIGLQLIRGFARQLGATLVVDEGPGSGTRYDVALILRRDRVDQSPALAE